jgi:hypothetical protein
MALITTTGSLIRQYNAFTGLSALERSQSGVARAEVVYYNVNDDWPSPGSGNTRLYQTGQIDLPKDFGYVLTDARILLTIDAASLRQEAVAQYQLFPGGILGPQINGMLESSAGRMDEAGSTAIGSITAEKYNSMFPSIQGEKAAIVYELKNKPSAILYPFASNTYTSTPNPATVFNFAISEASTNRPACDVSVYIRFLQYDIDQSYNYVIQSPQLTR